MNGKCHIKKQKSRKTALSDYYTCVSCDLLLMPLGTDRQTDTHMHTHTHTYRHANKNDFKKPGTRGLRVCAPGLKMKCEPFQLWLDD